MHSVGLIYFVFISLLVCLAGVNCSEDHNLGGQVHTPPSVPVIASSYNTPPDNSTGQSINSILRWSCSDPGDDTLVYDVCFGTSLETPLAAWNIGFAAYEPGVLSPGTAYYWRVVAKKSLGVMTSSPI